MPRNMKTKKRTSSRRKDSWEDRESKDMKRDDKRKSSNDPKWYATDPSLLRDSASIPFSWPLGMPFSLNPNNSVVDSTPFSANLQSDNLPGICVEYITPAFGGYINTDALNVAAASMYTFVRHTNAGHANYDPNDLMLYVMGMTQVYSYINMLERCYAIATLYEQRNRYLPDALFTAQGIDGDSIKNNLADFRYAINVLINNVSSIAVPATMSVFLRQAMMYAYLYAESETIKDQLYMFAPMGFLQFALDGDSAGKLELINFYDPNNLKSWQDLINYGTTMFNKIWDQEDFGIMSGDILKSYGSNILSLSSLDEVVPFSPVLDPMVLHQIKNARPILTDLYKTQVLQNASKSRLTVDLGTFVPYSESHYLRKVDYLNYLLTSNKVLSLDASEPTPEMVIEATRLIAGVDRIKDEPGVNRFWITFNGGSEIVQNVKVWTYRYNGDLIGYDYRDYHYAVEGDLTINNVINAAAIIRHFKYAPQLIIGTYDPDADKMRGKCDFWEVDNYAVLSGDDITKMHTAALLNMLNVPSVAKNVRV